MINIINNSVISNEGRGEILYIGTASDVIAQDFSLRFEMTVRFI